MGAVRWEAAKESLDAAASGAFVVLLVVLRLMLLDELRSKFRAANDDIAPTMPSGVWSGEDELVLETFEEL